jgi:pimeloyl-ACP methyl ester carboxylesterase
MRRAAWPRVGLALLLAACSAPGPHGSVTELFAQPPWPLDAHYTEDNYHIHYVTMPGRGPARIVFIHGSPGRWQNWADYLRDPQLLNRATLVAPDRPGFGKSEPGRVVTDLGRQAQLLEPLLHGPGSPVLLVGHSYGGTIAARMAMDYPDEVAGVVLIAPAIDPDTEYPAWYDHALAAGPLRWLTPARLGWSTDEIRPLNPQLQQMRKRWRQLKMPVLLIQGTADREVDPRTADFASRMLAPGNAVVRVRDAGHRIIWKREKFVRQSILDVLDASRSEPQTDG